MDKIDGYKREGTEMFRVRQSLKKISDGSGGKTSFGRNLVDGS